MSKDKDGDNRREEKEEPEMDHGYAAYGFSRKNIIIHIGGTTIKRSEYGITNIYFQESASPECKRIENELHFETSGTKIILIPDGTFEDDAPKPEKVGDNQVVFTINIGSFILEVNDFIIRLAHCSLTEKEIRTLYQGYKFRNSVYYNDITMESKYPKYCRHPNWVFFHTGGSYDDMYVIAVPDDQEIEFGNLREGKFVPFPGSAGVTYKVTKVEHNKWTDAIYVTVQTHKDGSPTGELYTVTGYRSYDWFIPSIPPRAYR